MRDIDTIMKDRMSASEISEIKKESQKRVDDYLNLKLAISKEINKYVDENNLSFSDIKSGLDTSTSQTQRIMKGESGFTLDTIIKVAGFIGKSPKIIFE